METARDQVRIETNACPSESVWIDLAAGCLSALDSEHLIHHAAFCAQCAEELKRAVEAFSPTNSPEEETILANLETSRPKRKAELARDLSNQVSRKGKPKQIWAAWAAVAAALIVTVGVGIFAFVQYRVQQPPFQLIASAYAQNRTLELRIAGAPYGPLRNERGSGDSTSNRSYPLLESQAKIRQHLDRAPQDALWLLAEGRTEILEWHYDEAIETLKRALDLVPATHSEIPEILVDLATGYYQRAEATHRPIDYSMAADLLGQAIQKDPSLAVAHFNRGIVFEKEHLYEPAVNDWQKYLRLDPTGGWADEARQRIENVRKKMAQAKFGEQDRLKDLPEYQLEQVLTKGVFTASDRAQIALANMLERDHADKWLGDLLRSNLDRDVIRFLASAAATRAAFAVDKFPNELKIATVIRAKQLPQPVRIWLEYERAYRVTHSPAAANCLAEMDSIIALARKASYFELLAQFLIEKSFCTGLSAEISEAENLNREAYEIARSHRFPVAELRAGGFLGAHLLTAGLYREAAELHQRMLHLFWSRPFPYMRGQEYYNGEVSIDEALHRSYAGQAAAQMSARCAQLAGATVTEAVANALLAEFEENTNLQVEAKTHWQTAEALFSRVADNGTANEYRAYAETKAIMAMPTKDRQWSSNRAQEILKSTNPLLIIPLRNAMARAEDREGRFTEAESYLEHSLRMLRTERPSASNAGRKLWRSALSDTYRELVRHRLLRGRIEDAYRLWQEYLEADAQLLGSIRTTSHRQVTRPEVVITFARLENRYGIWAQKNGKVKFSWLNDADEVDRKVMRFVSLCADPMSKLSRLRELGQDLAQTLLDPVSHDLGDGGLMIVQPDGAIWSVPWNAVPLGTSNWLGLKMQVAIAPDSAGSLACSKVFRKALVVAATVIDSRRVRDYRPLPEIEEEIAAVRTLVPEATVLSGASANTHDVERGLEANDIFHYAGHAVQLGQEISLLIAPDRANPAGLWKPSGRTRFPQLVVLSACSTGKYEDANSLAPQSLARSLLLAGSEQVVASGWDIDSSATATLMKYFYLRLHSGATVADALRQALTTVARMPDWSHPYYWASFALYT